MAKHDVRFDEPPTTVPGPALWGIVAAGGLVGAAIGLSATGERDEAWLVWMLLAVALTAAAALTGVIGWRAWDLLGWLYHGMERPKRQLLWDLAPVVIILAALAAYGIYNTSYRGELLVATTLVGGAPAIAALAEARRILREPLTNGGLGDTPFDALVELRLLLRRLLAAGGALVALSTLALGASLERPTTGSVTRSGSIPKPSVLVFGALGSAIVGLVYVPTATALRDRIRAEVRAHFPSEDADAPGEQLLRRLQQRRELEKLLVGEQGIYDEMLTGIVVLGPLLTSAVQRYVL